MDLLKIFSNKATPKDIAKDRLRLILIHDRGDIAPEVLENIRTEVMQVISKYIEIEAGDVDISINKNDDVCGEGGSALVANIPIKSVRGR